MGSLSSDQAAMLEEARAAHREHRYDAAYSALRAALQLEPLQPDDLRRLADSAWWLGLMAECLKLTERAHRDFLTTGHLDRAAAQALDLGGMLAMRGEYALASGWLGRARRLLEGRPVGPIHGMLMFTDMSTAIEDWRLDDADQLAAEIRRLGEEHGVENLVALGHLGAGLVSLRRGGVDLAFSLMEESMLRVIGGGVDPDWVGYIYCTIVSACLDVADLNRARRWSDAAHRWLEDFSDAVMFTGVCRAHVVNLLVVEGDWDSAERMVDLVVRDLAELNVAAVAEAEYQRGECHRLRGDFERADAGFARSAALGREPEPGHALLRLMMGDPQGAWVEISDAAARSAANPFQCARLLHAAVVVAVAAGHEDSATKAAGHLRELAGMFATPGFLAWADHADGLVALCTGRPGDAVDLLASAGADYRRMYAWYDAAVVEALLAEAHRQLGDLNRAGQHDEAAAAVFRRLGAPAPLVPRPNPSRPLAGGLTAREAEVLCRIAAGLSNRDVGRALTISEATVRRHLANIYLKLDVTSRTQAVAWAHTNGLITAARA